MKYLLISAGAVVLFCIAEQIGETRQYNRIVKTLTKTVRSGELSSESLRVVSRLAKDVVGEEQFERVAKEVKYTD